MCESACSLLQGRKERRRYSVNRSFFGDYINLDAQPKLRRLLNDKRERVEFADLVTKYDRRGKVNQLRLSLFLTRESTDANFIFFSFFSV